MKEVTPFSREGQPCVQMIFEYVSPLNKGQRPPPTPEAPRESIPRAKLLLDPNRYWCILEWELDNRLGGKNTFSIRYDKSINNFPVPKHTTYYMRDKDGNWGREECEFERIAHRVIPEHEFTVAAYGIDDPSGAALPESPKTWLWVVVAIVIAGMLGGVFFLLKRRGLAGGVSR